MSDDVDLINSQFDEEDYDIILAKVFVFMLIALAISISFLSYFIILILPQLNHHR